jgi:hypothetical protein
MGLLMYVSWVRRDRLSRNLGLWGMLGGGLGFSLGQSLQAFHAWNREWFQSGWVGRLDPLLNWWNLMEIAFGAIWGLTLAMGLWLNRREVDPPEISRSPVLPPVVEWGLLAVYLPALIAWQFLSVPALDAVADHAITMGLIPLVAVAGGRWWPYLLALPIVALPIAGKTFRELCLEEGSMPVLPGVLVYLLVPLVSSTWLAIRFADRARQADLAEGYLRATLLLTTWLYFGLNFAFFRFPWPWESATARTPSAIIFTLCAIGLTVGTVRMSKGSRIAAGSKV